MLMKSLSLSSRESRMSIEPNSNEIRLLGDQVTTGYNVKHPRLFEVSSFL